MNTMQFLNTILNWLLADPSHVVFAASALSALTPTPSPSTPAGRLYKVLDLFALNFLHAKENGVALPEVAQQVAALLAQQKSQTPPAVVSFPPAPKDPQ